MNIGQAKDYIKNSINIYLKKDEYGDYRIPVMRQRPIFLLGAPGIGKTAIMEQIASEMGIALVSYSMTHHTRQSALGLPFIKQKEYEGKTYDVSEYTMSEIISSIYETMESSGVKEGILFLDEINCVSETLAPSMLQFLQYKVFGRHSVPDGWVIVTAGNPPEYNKSVREFDVVTMDRLKVLEVEADYPTWKKYAVEKGIHPAVLNFLELKKEYFYHMETTKDGRKYVTARGWEDLSEIILMYEEEGLKCDEELAGQYLRSEQIVREFCAYYDLYNKYKNDYRVDEILAGGSISDAVKKVEKASFDERLSLLGILIEKEMDEMKSVVATVNYIKELMTPLKSVKESDDIRAALVSKSEERDQIISKAKSAGSLSDKDRKKHKRIKAFLDNAVADLDKNNDYSFEAVNRLFENEVSSMKESVEVCKTHLHHMFSFVAEAFGAGDGASDEMLILVTEMTVGTDSSGFISMFGCDDYRKYNGQLMVSERRNNLKDDIAKILELD